VSDATATVAVRVPVPPERAFALFVHDIDRWWRRGRKYRHSGPAHGTMRIEQHLDGRVFETWRDGDDDREFELGRVLVWQPPHHVRFTWRNQTFAAIERTEVEVTFTAAGDDTLVTVRHHGWAALRPDHPARHGLAGAELSRFVGMWWGELLSSLRESAATGG
jgi:uncharacterized protein YndB with AHSA1/START domain